MSGSSLDGLDLAAVEFKPHPLNGWEWQLLKAATLDYTPEWQQRLQRAHTLDAIEILKLDSDYGHLLGMMARQWLLEHDLRVELVASHGHTLFHQPQRQFTFQIGQGEALVTHLTVPVITRFRDRDIALGGEGAPLVPQGERDLFGQYNLLLNLGGIANLSVFQLGDLLPGTTWLRNAPSQLGYDITGCNQLLNAAAQRAGLPYDKDGQLAQAGKIDPKLLGMLENLDFLRLPPPRSLSNEYVRNRMLPLVAETAPEDACRTVVEHVALQVRSQLKRLERSNEPLLATGGGAFHPLLIERLSQWLGELNIQVVVPQPEVVCFKEAIIFAGLGLRRALGWPTTLADVTGARKASSGGTLHLPEGWSLWH
jgi:anhydro-N-acetylmuramic acid kinase